MSNSVTAETPWLGLSCFTENDRAYFFGRRAELRDLYERVVHKPLTILFGQSGLGKTSLVRAALSPLLREKGYTPVLVRLDHAIGAPPYEQQVLAELLRALAWPAAQPANDLWGFFHDPALGFVTSEGTVPACPVLIFDQFEEIFTLARARAAEVQAFQTCLSGLVENRLPEPIRTALETDDALAERLWVSLRACQVLISLRDDFLHELERWRRVMPSLMDNRQELRLLNGAQALEAVVEPGRLRCREQPGLPPIVSRETGAAIVRFVAGVGETVPLEEIEAVPPLLSLLCAELNGRRGADPVIRPEQLAGRAEDVLAQFYERSFSGHPPAVRRFAEERLISPEGFRQSANHDAVVHEMREAGFPPDLAHEAIRRLVDDRLLVTEERNGIRRIEFTHDILTGVARGSRDARRAREAESARRRGRRRVAIAVTSFALLLAAVSVPLTFWAWSEKKDGEELLRKASFSDSEESMRKLNEGSWNAAVAYGALALRLRPENTTATWQLLTQTLPSGVMPLRILAHDGPVTHAQFLADNSSLLTVNDGTRLVRWRRSEAGRWIEEDIFKTEAGETVAALSPSGTQVCLLRPDGSARLADWANPAAGRKLDDVQVGAAAFSAEGDRLLTTSESGATVFWDAQTGVQLASLPPSGRAVALATLPTGGHCMLIGTASGTVHCWKTDGKQTRWREEWTSEDAVKPVKQLALSPEGSRCALVAGDRDATCWSVPVRFKVASLQGEESAACVAYAGDGSMVATGGVQGSIQLWERTSGKTFAYLHGHRNAITALQFSHDGRFLLSASRDGTARLWQLGRLNPGVLNQKAPLEFAKSPAAPAWVSESLLPFLCATELNEQGKLSALDVESQKKAQATLEPLLAALQREGSPSASPWDRFLKWLFLSDPRTRTLSPVSEHGATEYVESIMAKPALGDDDLRSAWLAAPGNPLIQWEVGRRHAGGPWGAWLQDRAKQRLALPATQALYGGAAVERWKKKFATPNHRADRPGTEGFTNSLGMKFAPVIVGGGQTVLFGVWETRLKDFLAYAEDPATTLAPAKTESPADAGNSFDWRFSIFQKFGIYPEEKEFENEGPVVCITRQDAIGFCEWLTNRERALHKITEHQLYRLPTDEEWSWAVGIGEEEAEAFPDQQPKDKDSKVESFPWGGVRPIPERDFGDGRTPQPLGNYGDQAMMGKFSNLNCIKIVDRGRPRVYDDGFPALAPVGRFPANEHGLFDLAGNAWEWCSDLYDRSDKATGVVRGGSWFISDGLSMRSSFRCRVGLDDRARAYGFRCVLADDRPKP